MEKNGKTYDGKYPHGFLPKISYWMGKWEEAAEVRDEESMKTAERLENGTHLLDSFKRRLTR